MKRGLTMIEVLTVVVIIAIVLAIAFPVFFRAKARAKQTVCESNLHQIYLGIEMYAQDYGELPWLANQDPTWYRNYTGGTLLKCPTVGKAPTEGDYVISAGFGLDLPVGSEYREKWERCRARRGSEFPYAFDPNHRRKIDAYQGNGQRVILVRANGSVKNLPYKGFIAGSPCDNELGPDVQH